MRSAKQCPTPVDEYLTAELTAGRIAGPLDSSLSQQLQISMMNPKGHVFNVLHLY